MASRASYLSMASNVVCCAQVGNWVAAFTTGFRRMGIVTIDTINRRFITHFLRVSRAAHHDIVF
ncbi:MAG: hypothetical protein NTX46_00560 [Chloroflexi bacterium]|nr:hypothetical protein [Chloroflexota bacterium]